jgi:hypothetical protein
LTQDGRGQSVNGSATDYAANANNTSVTGINIDQTPPTLVYGTASPAANQYGWNNTNVSFPYTTADNLSGMDNNLTPPSPVVITAEGTNQSTSVTVFDIAGNSATFTTPTKTPVMIDETAPVIAPPTAITATDGKTYTGGQWTNQNVMVTFSCSDNLSGPLVINGITNPMITGLPPMGATVAYQQPDKLHSIATVTLTAETTGVTLTANCQDFAGNNAQQQSFGPVLIDKTPPVVTGTATAGPSNAPYSAGTWTNQSPVTVTFSCSDSLSGPNLSSITGNTVLAGPTQNTTVNGSCMDVAGNSGTGSFVVMIDQVAPSIMITSPSPGQTILLNSQIVPVFTCTDGAGGIDLVNCMVTPSASPYPASPVGPGTFTVNAVDQAGNQSSASANYVVLYNFTGFQAPLQVAVMMNPPSPQAPPQPTDSGSFNIGTTLPVAWTLQDGANTVITDTTTLTSIVAYPNATCTGTASGVGTTLYNSTTGTAAFSYDSTNSRFLFNWNTTGMAAGCVNLVVTTNDTAQWSTIVHLATGP